MKIQKLLFITTLALASFIFGAGWALAYQQPYKELISRYVVKEPKEGITSTLIDYKSWGENGLHQKAMSEIAKVNTSIFKTPNEKMAFWINAYNLLTIDLIIQKKETKSIKNLGGFFQSPWKKYKWKINNKNYSLDDIEHGILRPMGDPRIHAAINCASLSCPDLLLEPYTEKELNKQLNMQTKTFLANTGKGIKRDKNKVKISKIMKWFSEDFGGSDAEILNFINKYSSSKLQKVTKIDGYLNYNWNLNIK